MKKNSENLNAYKAWTATECTATITAIITAISQIFLPMVFKLPYVAVRLSDYHAAAGSHVFVFFLAGNYF